MEPTLGNYVLTSPRRPPTSPRHTLTVTGVTASNKVYDGTAAATLDTAGGHAPGVVAGDA